VSITGLVQRPVSPAQLHSPCVLRNPQHTRSPLIASLSCSTSEEYLSVQPSLKLSWPWNVKHSVEFGQVNTLQVQINTFKCYRRQKYCAGYAERFAVARSLTATGGGGGGQKQIKGLSRANGVKASGRNAFRAPPVEEMQIALTATTVAYGKTGIGQPGHTQAYHDWRFLSPCRRIPG
jgi:hypothetical protein